MPLRIMLASSRSVVPCRNVPDARFVPAMASPSGPWHTAHDARNVCPPRSMSAGVTPCSSCAPTRAVMLHMATMAVAAIRIANSPRRITPPFLRHSFFTQSQRRGAKAQSLRLCVENSRVSELEAQLHLRGAHRLGSGDGAEARVLRNQTRRYQRAVRVELR